MDQNACRQAAILIQQIQTTVKTLSSNILSSNMTAFNGVLDTGGKVLAAGGLPWTQTVPADPLQDTAEPESQDGGTFGKYILRKRKMYILVAS